MELTGRSRRQLRRSRSCWLWELITCGEPIHCLEYHSPHSCQASCMFVSPLATSSGESRENTS